MNQLIGDCAIHPDTIALLRERGGTWAAYQNVAMDSSNRGHLQFLQYGEGRTYKVPPEQYPSDTAYGLGWRYRHVGYVDLASGTVVNKEVTP